MSIRLNNTFFKFPEGITLNQAMQQADKILFAITLVRNPYDFIQVEVNQNGSWSFN